MKNSNALHQRFVTQWCSAVWIEASSKASSWKSWREPKSDAEVEKRQKGFQRSLRMCTSVRNSEVSSKAHEQLHPENLLYRSILPKVHVGLSDDEALHLASQHNVNGYFVHKTYRDYVC